MAEPRVGEVKRTTSAIPPAGWEPAGPGLIRYRGTDQGRSTEEAMAVRRQLHEAGEAVGSAKDIAEQALNAAGLAVEVADESSAKADQALDNAAVARQDSAASTERVVIALTRLDALTRAIADIQGLVTAHGQASEAVDREMRGLVERVGAPGWQAPDQQQVDTAVGRWLEMNRDSLVGARGVGIASIKPDRMNIIIVLTNGEQIKIPLPDTRSWQPAGDAGAGGSVNSYWEIVRIVNEYLDQRNFQGERVVTIQADYNAADGDVVIVEDDATVFLPEPTGKLRCSVKLVGVGKTVIVNPGLGVTIDGEDTWTWDFRWEAHRFYTDGNNWFAI